MAPLLVTDTVFEKKGQKVASSKGFYSKFPNDPDNDHPSLKLALTVIAGRKNHKQSSWSTDKHALTAVCCQRYKNMRSRNTEGRAAYMSHTTPKGWETEWQTLVEACGPCQTS